MFYGAVIKDLQGVVDALSLAMIDRHNEIKDLELKLSETNSKLNTLILTLAKNSPKKGKK